MNETNTDKETEQPALQLDGQNPAPKISVPVIDLNQIDLSKYETKHEPVLEASAAEPAQETKDAKPAPRKLSAEEFEKAFGGGGAIAPEEVKPELPAPKRAPEHGGNPLALLAKYPDAPKPYVDLSTGINPYAYPLAEYNPQWATVLPEAKQINRVKNAAAKYYGLDDAHNVAIGAGMQPLMFALAMLRLRVRGPGNVKIFGPTYAEHARVWEASGHTVSEIKSLGEVAMGEVVIVCNPNNPDGKTHKADDLALLAEQLAPRQAWLIIDEAFVDTAPQLSLTKVAVASSNMIVLRSCGKFFGVAGLRTSFAIGWEGAIEWLNASSGPWPISTAACHQLPQMFADTQWCEKMRETLFSEAARWRGMLTSYFTIVGFTPLFTLLDSPNAEHWAKIFGAKGIAVRTFDYNNRWLRVGLPHRDVVKRVQDAFAAGSAW